MKFTIFCIKHKIEVPEICVGFIASFGSLLGCCAKLQSLILKKNNDNFTIDRAVKIVLSELKQIISEEYQKY